MYNNNILTNSQAAVLLGINENTLNALVYAGQIPHIKNTSYPLDSRQFHYKTMDIVNWLDAGPQLVIHNNTIIKTYKDKFEKKYPQALAKLREFDRQFIPPRRGKGYSLTKVRSKKLGYIYHVRFIVNGKLLPTWRSTHTNDKTAAEAFAVQNRDKVIHEYLNRSKTPKKTIHMYAVFRKFYEQDSVYLKKLEQRGRIICDNTRRAYHCVMLNKWLPFLRKEGIKQFNELSTPLMARFQDYLLDKNIKPQSVNHYVNYVNCVFDYLVTIGLLQVNPCATLSAIKVGEEQRKVTGCYEVNKLKNVFYKRWKNELSYYLNLLIYTTNMRNSEIAHIQPKDIITINNIHFLDIPKSKSRNGQRMVPLHDFVYRKLQWYIRRHHKGPDDYLFKNPHSKKLRSAVFNRAMEDLAEHTGYSREQIEKENLRFYSGRHFWKTMMNANGLGEVEEYFMGHKVSADAAKVYNHRDKQGRYKIALKAREVFKILDRHIFARKPG